MTEAVLGSRARTDTSRWFYFWIAATCWTIAVLGFMPTYFLPLAQGKFHEPPLVHLHGIVLFSWMTFFVAQSWLVASGKTLTHRTWGVAGVSLFSIMVSVITATVSMRVAQASMAGQPAGLAHDVKAFAWVTMGGLAYMIPAFTLALVNVKRPETHKRLIVLTIVSMLAAPIARWFLTFLAPPLLPPPVLPAGVPFVSVPPPVVAVAPALVGCLVLVAAMVYDWRTRGRPHRVYVIGGAFLLLYIVSIPVVAETAAWQAVATALGRLAG
jgi:hypothetical protein